MKARGALSVALLGFSALFLLLFAGSYFCAFRFLSGPLAWIAYGRLFLDWGSQVPDEGIQLDFDVSRLDEPPNFENLFIIGLVRHIGNRAYFIALWPILLAIIIFDAALIWWWRKKQMKPGYCSACGYDLRGSVGGRCSECGKANLPAKA